MDHFRPRSHALLRGTLALGACLAGLRCSPAPAPGQLIRPDLATVTVTVDAPPSASSSKPPAATVALLPAPGTASAAPPSDCDRIDLGLCTAASRWIAGCKSEISFPIRDYLAPAVVDKLAPCLAAEPASDQQCGGVLQRCVHEAVLAAAVPSAADGQRCDALRSACQRASIKPDYSREQCSSVLAASSPGPVREQVEQALGPKSKEPRPCSIEFIWPNLPFTPYFP